MKISNKSLSKYKHSGFTIVEMVVVIVVVGILAAVTIVSYNGVQSKAIDTSILSDLDALDGLETNYGLKNSVAGKSWYSGSGIDSDLDFTPSGNNVIDVATNSSDYCIRGYSPSSTKNSIFNAFSKESSGGACDNLDPSFSAVANSAAAKVWLSVSLSGQTGCGVSSGYVAYCWGRNNYGQLGDGTTTDRSKPVAVDTSMALSGLTIKSFSVGSVYTCAIASDNNAYCWGRNNYGQLGDGTTTDRSKPVAVVGLNGKTVTAIVSGTDHTCAIASGNAYCWGLNSATGMLGDNSTVDSYVPVAVYTSGALSGKTVISIDMGADSSCVIASDNQVYCWGFGGSGQLGNNSTGWRIAPDPVIRTGALLGKTVKFLAAASYNHCVIASDDQAYCWGNNIYRQVGNQSSVNSKVPAAVTNTGALSGLSVKSINGGTFHFCAIASNNKAYCWGDNLGGALGDNSETTRDAPVEVVNTGALIGKKLTSITGGLHTSCAKSSEYKLYCWGKNDYGLFGDGTANSSLVPTIAAQVP